MGQNVGPDLFQTVKLFDSLIVSGVFKKLHVKEMSRRQQKHEKLASRQRVNTRGVYFMCTFLHSNDA